MQNLARVKLTAARSARAKRYSRVKRAKTLAFSRLFSWFSYSQGASRTHQTGALRAQSQTGALRAQVRRARFARRILVTILT